MDEEQLAKIESAMAECLELCRATDRPFMRLTAFLDKLKADTTWTDAERIELQTRVIRVLVYRMQGGADGAK